jgi:antagonist of KipI
MLLVLDPGALSTVQDLGRPGHGSLGVAPSGAMDPWALRVGNRLVGNDDGDAAIEMTMSGPTIAFERDAVVALTGSRFDARMLRVVTAPAARWDEAFIARAGETIEIRRTTEGARAYLAVQGGIDIAPFLGSRATQVAAGIGGRVLQAGDRIDVGHASPAPLRRARSTTSSYRREQTVRAIRGPQEHGFGARALERFFGEPFTLSTRADRTGIRLEGSALEPARSADIDPEGVVTGAVQVPADGQPIVLCNDRPATGGYAKIAVVFAADMHLAAHAKPGDTLRFTEGTIEEARAAWREREERLLGMIEDA